MKNFFSVNIDELSGEDVYSPPQKPFIVRRINADKEREQAEALSRYEELQRKWSLPTWLIIVRVVAICLGAIFLVTVLRALLDSDASIFKSPYALAFLIGGIVFVGVGVFLFIYEKKKRYDVESSPEFVEFMTYISELDASLNEVLEIPADKVQVDVFYYPYHEKDGKITDNKGFKYINQSLDLFVEGHKLCLADAGTVFGIDTSLFRRMLINPQKVTFAQWCKAEEYNKGEFKDYDISMSTTGIFAIKNSCSIQFTKDDEKFEIVIPPYEIKHFEALLGIKAQVISE